MVDKFLINPPTTYLSKDFLSLMKERGDIVEYRQANLHNPGLYSRHPSRGTRCLYNLFLDVVAKCFDDPAPNGRPFTYIFDGTGDIKYDRPIDIQISDTFIISLGLARAASQRKVKAYVRAIGPFFAQADPKKKFKEEDEKGWKPDGPRGVWWLESLRAIGSIPDLPLVVLRMGIAHGPGIIGLEGAITMSRISLMLTTTSGNDHSSRADIQAS